MIDASILTELADLNLDGDQLSAVIKIVAKIQAGDDERKAAHRAAQAKYRNKNRNGDITGISQGDHHPSSKGSSPTPPSPNLQPIPPSPPKGGSSPADEAIEIYRLMAERTGLAVPRNVNGNRRRQLDLRLREHGLPAIIEAIGKIEHSRFCLGDNDRGWRADMDFLLQAKSFTALLEGKYDNRPLRHSQAPPRKTAFQQQQDDARKAIDDYLGIHDHDNDTSSNGSVVDLDQGNWRSH